MKTGDIVLIPFPFAEFTNRKVRPAVVVCETKDSYKDLVLCAISSVIPLKLNENEILLSVDKENGLRKDSVLKLDRIVTAKEQDVIAQIGKLNASDLQKFKEKFRNLVDS
jgi:mRNA interferase MazF